MADSFGIVQAAQRARAWAPHLKTDGQRLVLAGLVLYTGADSQADPTANEGGQLPEWTGLTARSVRRSLTELMELGAIAPVGGNGPSPIGNRSKGGKPTRWTVLPNQDTIASRSDQDMIASWSSDPIPGHGTTDTRTGDDTYQDTIASHTEFSEKTEKGAYVVADAESDSSSGAIEEDCEGHDQNADECRACMRRRFPKLSGEKLGDYEDRITWLMGLAAAGELDPESGMTDEDYEYARG